MLRRFYKNIVQMLKVEREIDPKGAIVVSISPAGLIVASFGRQEHGIVLSQLAVDPLPPHVFDNLLIKDTLLVSDALSNLLSGMHLTSDVVVCALPYAQVRVKVVEIDSLLSDHEQYKKIKEYVNQFFPDIEKRFYVDYSILPQIPEAPSLKKNKKEGNGSSFRSPVSKALLVGCSADTVDTYETLFNKQHLKLGLMDVDLYASIRAMSLVKRYQLKSALESHVVGLIEFDYAKISLTVLQGDYPIYQNVDSYSSVLWNSAGYPDENETVRGYSELFARLDRFLQFFYAKNQGCRISVFYLAGLGALLPNCLEQFNRRFGGIVKMIEFDKKVVLGNSVNQSTFEANVPILLPVIGLGMRVV